MSIKQESNKAEFAVSLTLDVGEATLDNSNIKQLYFIEDLFSYTNVGKIILEDEEGILEYGPLTGNEFITILYGEDNDIQKTFKIYKISRIDQKNQNKPDRNTIEMFFAEPMFFLLNFLQFSRSWTNTRISDIVKHIGENYLQVNNWDLFEQTNEKLDYFYIPYWNMNTTLTWLVKRCTSSDNNQPGFCFYNNKNGTNFVTLEKLLSQKKLMKISDEDDGLYVFQDTNELLYNKILNWYISGLDMTLMKYLSGGVTWGYNTNTKNFIKQKHKYKDLVNEHTMLGKKSLFPDISDEKVSHNNLGENNIDNLNTIFTNIWNRKYNLQQCLTITVKGHQERYCGGMIEINWPSGTQEDQYNKHLHGLYLIKSITHTFSGYNNPSYKQKMICIKNGYSDSYLDTLVKAKKINKV